MKKKVLMAILIFGVVTMLIADRWHVKQWQAEKNAELESLARLCGYRLENSIKTRINAIQAVVSLFIIHPDTSFEKFSRYAGQFLKNNPPIRVLQYADAKTVIKFTYPPEKKEITVTRHSPLMDDPLQGPYASKAIEEKRPIVQGFYEQRQGSNEMIVVHAPIFTDNRFLGLAIGVYDVSVLVKEALGGTDISQIKFRLSDGSGKAVVGPDTLSPFAIEQSIIFGDVQWTMALDWKKSSAALPMYNRAILWVLIGFFLAGVLLLAYRSTTQTRLMEETVRERTKDLTREIAERKKAQHALITSQRELTTLMGNLRGMVYRCRNVPEWTMEFVSDGCLQLTGYLSSEIENNKMIAYGDLIHKDDRDTVWNRVQNALAIKDHFDVEYRIITKSGELKWVMERGIGVFDENKKLLTLEGFISDISNQKKLESQLRQAQKMEAIGTLAGGIAHDFNNILASIIGFSELALIDAEKESAQYNYIQEILVAGLRAKDLVKQILTFARQSDAENKPVKIRYIVKEVLKLLRSSCRQPFQ